MKDPASSMDDCLSVGSSRGTSRSAGSYHSRSSSRKTTSSGGETPIKLVDNLYLDTKTNMVSFQQVTYILK